jgi:hypothetical protein
VPAVSEPPEKLEGEELTMAETEQLSPWWGRAVAFTFILRFAVLILLTVKA